MRSPQSTHFIPFLLILIAVITTVLVWWPASQKAARRTTSKAEVVEATVAPVAANFTVNASTDSPDSSVGDGHCDTDANLNNGDQCTLRAAIQETNSNGAGPNTINFNLPANTVIILNSVLPDVSSNVTINGGNANTLTVQRSTAAGTPSFRIFTIASGMTVTIGGLTLTNGWALSPYPPHVIVTDNFGGAIYSERATVTINDCIIKGNRAFVGGGLANRGGVMNINRTTITNNLASAINGGTGGGVSNGASDTPPAYPMMTIDSSTISNNTADGDAGGVLGANVITNSTIAANSARFGGGLTNGDVMTLENVTIAGNNATEHGGGIENWFADNGRALTFKNTIIAGNTSPAGPDCYGAAITSNDYNLIGNTAGITIAGTTTHNITGVDPSLGPLQDNGGPTMTRALLVGSPAIDAGNTSQTTDQRGQPRPVDDPIVTNAAGGNASDIGAYESHNLQVNTVVDADDGSCTSVGTGNGCTLREAINAANSQSGSEVISFAPALTAGGPASITLDSALPNLTSDLSIVGSGANLLTIRRNSAVSTPSFRIFTINSGIVVKVTDLTISNGHPSDGSPGSDGGAILNAGTLTVTNCTVSGNQAGDGVSAGGSANGGSGGGIFSSGTLTVSSSTFTNNRSGNGLGGGFAGGAAAIFSMNSLTMTGSTVSNNQAGVANAGGGGGAITSQGALTITNTTVSGNSLFGISSSGTFVLTNGTVTGNSRGGVSLSPPNVSGATGNATISNSLISGNSGSGITNNVSANATLNLTVINSTISNNSSSSLGGGILNGAGSFTSHAILTVINSTISGNTAVNGGGGIYNAAVFGPAQSDALIINTTISGNFDNSQGGGIFDISSSGAQASLTLNNCTVANNSVGNGGIGGGGIATSTFNSVTRLFLLNSIIATNTGQSGAVFNDIAGSADSSSSFNVIGLGGSGGLTNGTNNNQVSVANPLLGALANNGGPTMTHALLPGSPAINAGSNANLVADTTDLDGDGNTAEAIPFDQRGFARVGLGTVDVGAFESRGFSIAAAGGTPQSAPITSTFASQLSATVSSSFGEPVSGGAVIFTPPATGPSCSFTSSESLAIIVLLNGSGVATTPAFTANGIVGSYSVVASGSGLSGTANFSLTNSPAPTTTSVSSSANPVNFPQPLTLTATVSSAAGTPTGSVSFADGSNPLGSAQLNNGVAQLSNPQVSAGTRTITAVYSGDANFASSSGSLLGGQVVVPNLLMNPASITEGDSGTKSMTFLVNNGLVSNQTITVDYAIADGTATAGSDYVATSGTLTFAPGEMTKTVSVTINGDQKFEADETLLLKLSNPVNCWLNNTQTTGTILNDDAQGGIVSFAQPEYTVFEGDGAVTIAVNRTGETGFAAMVNYATDDTGSPGPCADFNGLASSKCDFTTAIGTLAFAPNETQKTITVLVNRDSYTSEVPSDAFTVKLSNLTGGAVFGTNSTATVKIMESGSPGANAIDDSSIFVRQHYHDFLNREADAPGLQFWTNEIESCGTDAACREVKRINVSGAFFLSIEFQQTGYLIERLYKTAYGDATGNSTFPSAHTLPVPMVRFSEFLADTQEIGRGVVVGQPGWEQQIENNKVAFINLFVQRSRFMSALGSMGNTQFVDTLNANAGNLLNQVERDQLIADLNTSAKTRAQVLRAIAEHPSLVANEFNRAFVLMQFFGYLRRNPDDPQDHDHTGYDFWLTKLNQFGGNFQNAEMVKAFISSDEYRHRFGP